MVMGNIQSSSFMASACFLSLGHHMPTFLSNPSDAGLGHSFSYVRPSSSSSSSSSFEDDSHPTLFPHPSFKCISGASLSANSSTNPCIPPHHQPFTFFHAPAAFESSSSFTSIPFQPLPKEPTAFSGPLPSNPSHIHPDERAFASGPIPRGFLSGPLDIVDPTHFSAPITGFYHRKRPVQTMLKHVSRPMKRVISKTLSRLHFHLGKQDEARKVYSNALNMDCGSPELQWAQGKAGEDRVHIVLSDEHGWLFVGIYDGFNGPDAPDFLLSHLYPAMQKELQHLVCRDIGRKNSIPSETVPAFNVEASCGCMNNKNIHEEFKENARNEAANSYNTLQTIDPVSVEEEKENIEYLEGNKVSQQRSKPQLIGQAEVKRNVLVKKHTNSNEEIDCKGSVKNEVPPLERWHYKFTRQGCFNRKKQKKQKEGLKKEEAEEQRKEKRRNGNEDIQMKAVDHNAVLGAMAKALEATELAFLDMVEQAIVDNPELALMGSCVLVMLMRDSDVYVMNVGDSRAIIAQRTNVPLNPMSSSRDLGSQINKVHHEKIQKCDNPFGDQQPHTVTTYIDSGPVLKESLEIEQQLPSYSKRQGARPFTMPIQLSSDHSTNVQEELLRIRAEHPDDEITISKDRVKGSLKVTRAFGAGFLKQPKWNEALLEMFRIDYRGMAPYITCKPALLHHRLGPEDSFLVLSSDGVYQYMTNEEVVSHIDSFMQRFPDEDPAQHLVEELLFRAATKAGMNLQELLEIPQGDRRKYHDDICVLVISLEGRLWRSCT